MADVALIKSLLNVPSVGTACLPVLNVLSDAFGPGFDKTFVPDGFCLFQKAGSKPADIHVVLVAHVDEVGGCVYGARTEGGYQTRCWGGPPKIFAGTRLQAYDYLAPDASSTVKVNAGIIRVGSEDRLAIYGTGILPYRTAWTYREEAMVDGDVIEGKAVDPRITAYCVAEAVRQLDDPHVAALFVMAEECAMDVARKAVTFLSRNVPALSLIVNADVPLVANLGDARLDTPAIRVFEGHNFIDPSFGIRMVDLLVEEGVAVHLSAAKSGSQTILFTPLAPTISVALPGENIHAPRGRMSLTGTVRCVTLLTELAKRGVVGPLPVFNLA